MTFQFTRSLPGEPSIEIPAIGLSLRVRLPGSASDGALEVIETTNAPSFGPPMHRHAQTEVFRVLGGCYLFEVDGKRMTASAGDLISVPGGCAHAYVNITDEPASLLVMALPDLHSAEFFAGLAAVMQHGMPERETLNRFGATWGIEFLGPPLAADAGGVAGVLIEA